MLQPWYKIIKLTYNEKYFGTKDALCHKYRRVTIGQNCRAMCTNQGGHRDAFLNKWHETPCISVGLLYHACQYCGRFDVLAPLKRRHCTLLSATTVGLY
jgi:hypothetical protein